MALFMTMARLLAMAAMALPAAALAAEEGVQVEHPWARATPMRASTAAVYMDLTSAADDQLTGVTSNAAKTAEIHVTLTSADGVMQMRPLAGGLELPAGKTVTLAPGHLHVMLTGLYAPLMAGKSLSLHLTFAHAAPVDVTVPIMAVGAVSTSMPGMKM